MGTAHGWGTFPKCWARLNYGPMDEESAHCGFDTTRTRPAIVVVAQTKAPMKASSSKNNHHLPNMCCNAFSQTGLNAPMIVPSVGLFLVIE